MTPLLVSLLTALAVGVVLWPAASGHQAVATLRWLSGAQVNVKRPRKNWATKPPLGPLIRALGRLCTPAYRERTIRRIEQAGLTDRWGWEEFLGGKVLALLICLLYFGGMWLGSGSTMKLLLALTIPTLALFVPDQTLFGRVRRRKVAMEKELPAILNALAIATEAGLTLGRALQEVTRQRKGILAAALQDVVQQSSVGVSLSESLQQFAQRCEVRDITLFVATVTQGMQKGDSHMTQLLREQAKEAWTRRRQRAETMAQTASLKLFIPLAGLIFPALIIFLLSPAILQLVQFFTHQGH